MNDETFDVFRTRVRLPPTPPRRDMIYYDRKGYEDLRDSVMWVMDKLPKLFIFVTILVITFYCANGYAKSKKVKFYNFSEQQISGEIKKPATLCVISRTRAKFKRLLILRKSFRKKLIRTNLNPTLR